MVRDGQPGGRSVEYEVTHVTRYRYSEPVPVCHNMVHLQPRRKSNQVCERFRLVIHPEPNDLGQQLDAFDNHVSYFSIEQAHLGLSVTASSLIRVQEAGCPATDVAWDDVVCQLQQDRTAESLSAYEFAFPTERTRPFPELTAYAAKSFRPKRGIVESVRELTHRIFSDFEFDARATTVSTPVQRVFELKRGVCQDFAHLQLACLRGLRIAARYVSGYLRTVPPPGQERLVGADASHAWISVFCGPLGWIDFDPTNDMVPSSGHISVAWGRDYGDVTPVRGVILGGGTHSMSVSVDVAEVTND